MPQKKTAFIHHLIRIKSLMTEKTNTPGQRPGSAAERFRIDSTCGPVLQAFAALDATERVVPGEYPEIVVRRSWADEGNRAASLHFHD